MTDKLRLPAVRATLGTWDYYVSFMPVKIAVDRINTAEEIHGAKRMHDYLQRRITRRKSQIAHYLRVQPQRFFGSLVIGTYGGLPKWYEVGIRDDRELAQELPEFCTGALGILEVDVETKLFAIDGQHRLVGMREAMKEDETIGDDEISVLFVHGVSHADRKDDADGYERTRRLFTHLNRYAQKVSLAESIVLDEDDVIAIVTRDLVEFDSRLAGKVRVAKQKTLPTSEKKAWTSLQALYEAFDRLFKEGAPTAWARFKTMRPEEPTISAYRKRAEEFLRALENNFPCIARVFLSDADEEYAGSQRGTQGGHFLFRPLGLDVFAQATRDLMDQGKSIKGAVAALADVHEMDWNFTDPLFAHLLWNPETGLMLSGDQRKFVARAFLVYLASSEVVRKRQHKDLEDYEVMSDYLRVFEKHTGKDPQGVLPQSLLDAASEP